MGDPSEVSAVLNPAQPGPVLLNRPKGLHSKGDGEKGMKDD